MLRALAVIALAFTFNGCKQPGQSALSGDYATIYGRASAGPIRSADITVYRLYSDSSRGAVLGTAITDAHGNYSVYIPKYSGAVEIAVNHGYYYEESTGGIVALTGDEMRARISAVTVGDQGNEVGITPLTEVATTRSDQLYVNGLSLNDAIDFANRATSVAAGLNNILASPADPWSTLSDPQSQASKYAAVLAGISQKATDVGINSLVLAKALAADFSDGNFDGVSSGNSTVMIKSATPLSATGWSSVGTAMVKYIQSSANSAGFSLESSTTLVSAPDSDSRGDSK